MAQKDQSIPVIFGEVLFDCFEDGSRVIGGAPFNVAWHLQAFGCKPAFISRIGSDASGGECKALMQNWGMSTETLQIDPEHPTGEVRVTLNDGQPSYDILTARAFDFINARELNMVSLKPALIYHGSLGLRQAESAAALEQLLADFPETPVFMDVNLRSPWWNQTQLESLFERTRWLKINDEELEILVDKGNTLEQRAAHIISKYDLELVIVTRGKDGAFALGPAGPSAIIRPAADLTVVDTVGAGDAFASVCIVGLLKNWPVGLMLQRAQAFASLLVEQRGATISSRETYRTIQDNW